MIAENESNYRLVANANPIEEGTAQTATTGHPESCRYSYIKKSSINKIF
jgi:hypothetical protein